MRRARLIGGLLIVVATLAGCADSGAVDEADQRVIEPLDADALPGALNGLSVEREDISEILDSTKRPYLDAASLYSLRDGDELQATLQIGRFADSVDLDDQDFKQSLLSTVGAGAIRELRVGGETVFLTTGDRQQVTVWFEGEYMLILSTREEYERPRTLLREALEVEL